MTTEFTIKDHRLQGPGVEHYNSPNVTKGRRGLINATIGTVHWTGGDRIGPAHNTFLHPKGGASAHLMIDRDGSIRQYAQFSRRCWHAGKSSWHNRKGVNNFSIGVELVNAGLLRSPPGSGKFFTRGRNKREISPKQVRIIDGRPYHTYSREQFNSLRQIMRALHATYGITEWVGHQDVSPGRKSDPGPILSFEELAQMFRRAISEKIYSDATNPIPPPWRPRAKPSTVVPFVLPDWMRSLFSLFDPKETR